MITEAHKDTLRDMSLRNMVLKGDRSWVAIAKVMGKYLRLNTLWVASLADDVSWAITDSPYIEAEHHVLVARAMMRCIPRMKLSVEQESNSATASCMLEAEDELGSEDYEEEDDSQGSDVQEDYDEGSMNLEDG